MENWTEKRKEASFNTFAKYFGNEKEKYFASLKKLSEEALERFLKLERFYNLYFLLLQPTNPQANTTRDLKLIIFFSLIEALMSQEPWKSFEDWLNEKVPIEIKTKKDVERLRGEYYKMYGSGKKAREFFNRYVEVSDKKALLNMFTIFKFDKPQSPKINVSLDELIKIIYDLRSRFIHDARILHLFPTPLDEELVYSSISSVLGNKHIVSELKVELLQGILEKGMLRYFELLHERTGASPVPAKE